jgi:hypothetical protein
MAGTELMFSRLQAKTLSIGDVKPMAVFEAYTHKTGLFRGEAKKDQFPDAFVFECLKAEATKDDPLVIVSDDGDFEGPSNDANYISHIKSISDLFTALGLTTDEVPDVGSFLEASYEEVIRAVDKELNGWGLQVSDVEDADIDESSVKNVEFLKFATFRAAGERQEILVIGRVKMEVNVSYTHPDWDGPMYDSEDKVLIPFDNVSGERD